MQAERDAKRVGGVIAVANDIEVRLPAIDQRPDPEIARDAVSALKFELPFSYQKIKATVNNGWVTLDGEVEWNYQRERAESAVRRVKGVKGVTNQIALRPSVAASEVQCKSEEALRRSAEVDARRITVEAKGSQVTLRGKVRSWAERQEAERAAYAAPGVTRVDNRLTVDPSLVTTGSVAHV
jgi:osmotically-inducible protein OsmY